MPHLLAYKSGNTRHLVRWNYSPSSAARHLGAGYITCTMSHDAYKNFVWGEYYHEGNVDKARGYIGQSTRAGEESVANQLRAAVAAGNSTWPFQGNEWNTQSWNQPAYWYFCGGMCVSGARSPEVASESAMCVTAYHFTLPEAYRELDVLNARIVWRGLGSFVQNLLRPTSQPMFYPMKTWDDNNSCWGTNYKLMADYYQDAQSVAVHIVPGSTLNRNVFNPAKCFYVYDNTSAHNAYELRNLWASCKAAIGRDPTFAEILAWFNVDLQDSINGHWRYWGYQGSRDVVSSSVRFANHVYAATNGGTETTRPLFTAGSGWGLPYITGAADYPQTGEYVLPVLTLNDDDKIALKSADGLWVVAHGLPMLSFTNLTGGSHLPSVASNWQSAPWLGAANQSAVGRYIGTAIETLDTYKLEVTLG